MPDTAPPDVPVVPKRRGRPPKDPVAHALKEQLEAEAIANGEAVPEAPKPRGRKSRVDVVEAIAFRGARNIGNMVGVLASFTRPPLNGRLAFDAQVIGRPEGAQAIAKCVRQIADRNARFAQAIIKMDANAGMAGAGTALLITVLVPILINHEVMTVPAELRAMLGVPIVPSDVQPETEADEAETDAAV